MKPVPSIAVLLAAATAAGAASIVSTFNVASGNWSVAGNWSPSTAAPNNNATNTYSAVIGNGITNRTVTLNTGTSGSPTRVSALEVAAGSALMFQSSTARGLAVTGTGFANTLTNAGTIAINNGTASSSNTLAVLDARNTTFVNSGTITLNNTSAPVGSATAGSRLLIGNTAGTQLISNSGNINVNNTSLSAGALSAIRLGGNATFTGSGTITLGSGNTGFRRNDGVATNPTVTIAGGQTLQGAGSVGAGQINFALGSGGTLDVNGGTGMTINTATNWTSAGAVNVQAGKTLKTEDSFVQTAGSTTVAATANFDGALSGASAFIQGGSVLIEGGMAFSTIDLSGTGALSGTGILTADVLNGATINPGVGVGLLTIDGDYAQTLGGLLAVQLGGTNSSHHDVVSVSGTADLLGTLQVSLVNGFTPNIGDRFTVLNSTGFVNTGLNLSAPQGFKILYTSDDDVVLLFAPEASSFVLSGIGGAMVAGVSAWRRRRQQNS